MNEMELIGKGRRNGKIASSIVENRRNQLAMPTYPTLYLVLLLFLVSMTISIHAASPTSQVTFQPSRSSCDLDAYSNRDDIVSADSKDCVACYNAGCSWFDCADIDVDTASDCYDPNDEYRLQTCKKQTLDQCKSDYAKDMCNTGGVLLIVIGSLILLVTGFIRYNEYHYEVYRKSTEDVRFLDDGSIIESTHEPDLHYRHRMRGFHRQEQPDDEDECCWHPVNCCCECCECDDASTFWCYCFMFFAGGSMIIIGISFLVAYSILGSHVFDQLTGWQPTQA